MGGHLRGEEVVFRKLNGSLKEQMGGMMVCHKVCLGVVFPSSLLSCDRIQSSLADETSREGFMTIAVLLEYLS